MLNALNHPHFVHDVPKKKIKALTDKTEENTLAVNKAEKYAAETIISDLAEKFSLNMQDIKNQIYDETLIRLKDTKAESNTACLLRATKGTKRFKRELETSGQCNNVTLALRSLGYFYIDIDDLANELIHYNLDINDQIDECAKSSLIKVIPCYVKLFIDIYRHFRKVLSDAKKIEKETHKTFYNLWFSVKNCLSNSFYLIKKHLNLSRELQLCMS